MFREMRRGKQQVSLDECKRVLRESKRAVLSVIGDDGYPYGVPVNFVYDENMGMLYLHGATEGHKLDAIKNCNKISFTTWDEGYKVDGDWAWYVTSVICMGRAEIIDDLELMAEKIRDLGLRFTDAAEVQGMIDRNMGRVSVIAIHIEHMTGKLVHEK